MAIATADVAEAVSRYAVRFHCELGGGHHVASPVGAWLLLALMAPAARGSDREHLADLLGCDVGLAASVAGELLADPPVDVAAAAAAWSDPGKVSQEWLSGLPGSVETGTVPSQDQLDEWARRSTFGLIDRFPLEVDDETYLIAATALAVKLAWRQPFDSVPASELGSRSAWSLELERALRTPLTGLGTPYGAHEAFIAAVPGIGDVAVHVAQGGHSLSVMSVIADDDVPSGKVLAAAHDLARAHGRGDLNRWRRSLFDLPEGDGPLWTIRQVRAAERGELVAAVLPAWEAKSEHDLLAVPDLGFDGALRALSIPGSDVKARQVALARYTRLGFQAAAVTAVAAVTGVRVPQPGDRREAVLRFGHPYAVVAITDDSRPRQQAAERGGQRVTWTSYERGPWRGLPLFSAWVTSPCDSADDADGD